MGDQVVITSGGYTAAFGPLLVERLDYFAFELAGPGLSATTSVYVYGGDLQYLAAFFGDLA